jgi:very-short-patch-repair endonuclease
MSELWKLLVDHTRRHHAAIDSKTALELGIWPSTLHTWCLQGRLLHPAPGVYVVAGTAPTWRQQVSVAVQSTSGWASHRTAAALWELDGDDRRHIDVLTPKGLRRERPGKWLVHETRRFRGVDLDEVDGIPCTTVARTILDLPAVVHPFVVAQALDSSCRRWPEMLDLTMRRFLEISGRGRKGTRLLRAMIEERMGRGRFTQSVFETLALRLVRSVGLPEPVLQHQVREGDFVAYLDLAWPAIKWAVECDSLAWHSGKGSHEWDRQRRRRLKQLGWDLVEITYDDVTKRRSQTGEQLRTLHRTRARDVLSVLTPSLRSQRGQKRFSGLEEVG